LQSEVSPKTPTDAEPVLALADLLRQSPPPAAPVVEQAAEPVREIGGRRDGPEPTRYGDWEKNGRCIDF
jgi:hypothetical protein